MAASTQRVIHYSFVVEGVGVSLELWEPIAVSRSTPPYRFRWRQRFPSERDAYAALQHYIQANAVTLAIASRLTYLPTTDTEITLG